ncbi:MAG: hypothetical protein HKL96_09760 [Phycisphaerales bacterium]|nr:hypothetical protein [Phycisphaerales bacterium]
MPNTKNFRMGDAQSANLITIGLPLSLREPPELICTHPSKASILNHFGVECRKCPRTTGDELCRKALADPVHTLYLLSESLDSAGHQHGAVVFTSFSQLTEHIELHRHGWLKRELPRLGLMLEHTSREWGDHFGWLHLLREQFFDLQMDANAHVCREEEEIFPQIRELDRVRLTSRPPRDLTFAITELQAQHNQFEVPLRQIRLWTNNYTFPQDTPENVRQLNAMLRRFDTQHTQHLREEDEILFPQVFNRLDTLGALPANSIGPARSGTLEASGPAGGRGGDAADYAA